MSSRRLFRARLTFCMCIAYGFGIFACWQFADWPWIAAAFNAPLWATVGAAYAEASIKRRGVAAASEKKRDAGFVPGEGEQPVNDRGLQTKTLGSLQLWMFRRGWRRVPNALSSSRYWLWRLTGGSH